MAFIHLVNELSNTMDLDSTLIRAEALFKRFQRLVEAIDKKQNFPKPRVSRKSSTSPSTVATTSASTPPTSPSAQTSPNAAGKAKEDEQRKIISPELRKLLSRDVEVLPRKVVRKQGDGFTADARK